MKIENKTVVAATADRNTVTLYFSDGETMSLPTNERFTNEVINKITPALARGDTITLNMEASEISIFTVLEEKTKGLTRFFRVAKKALLGGGDEPNLRYIESISLPMTDYNLNNEEETVVAVVMPNEAEEVSQEDLEAAGDFYDRLKQPVNPPLVDLREEPKPQPVVITGAERLATQVKHFSEKDNPEGFVNFMKRIAAVSTTRKHSVNELLDFLKRNDLPIANDGCIVAYKRLFKESKSPGSTETVFVDTHTRSVKQSVGTKVFMKTNMVDPDRRNECSNGLHIGRWDYMGSFSGDAIVLVKVAPEDVIAVPKDYQGSKMRCCAYTIVAEVSKEGFDKLVNSQAMTGDYSMAQILTMVIEGKHAPLTQTVEITGPKGTGLVYQAVKEAAQKLVEPTQGEPEEGTPETPEADPKAVTETLTHALEHVETLKSTVDPAINSPEAIKEKIKAATKDQPVKVELTDAQKKASKLWSKVLTGEMSKAAVARQCGTSTRSLDRWAEKFGW